MDMLDLNSIIYQADIINQADIIDIAAAYTFFSSSQGTFTKTDHIQNTPYHILKKQKPYHSSSLTTVK